MLSPMAYYKPRLNQYKYERHFHCRTLTACVFFQNGDTKRTTWTWCTATPKNPHIFVLLLCSDQIFCKQISFQRYNIQESFCVHVCWNSDSVHLTLTASHNRFSLSHTPGNGAITHWHSVILLLRWLSHENKVKSTR